MFYTNPQPNAYNREIYWPRGKVLGGLFPLFAFITDHDINSGTGSSAINGLYMTRPGKEEINAWQDMLDDMDGNENWSWDSFYAAMKKSETFSPPTDAVAKEAGITWNSSTHGTDGPIHMSYPG
jgi:choline dehydrogenase-like flavoprotein